MNRHEHRAQVNTIAAVFLALKIDQLKESGKAVQDGDRQRLAQFALAEARRALDQIEFENP